MVPNVWLSALATAFGGALALAALARKRQSFASWAFIAGMGLFSLESLIACLTIRAGSAAEATQWQRVAFITKCFIPVTWFCFSFSYARGNYREFLKRWRFIILAAAALPFAAAIGLYAGTISLFPLDDDIRGMWIGVNPLAKTIHVALLLSVILVLINLEGTIRAAVGTMRWRIKFLILGLGIIFGTRVYTFSQTVLFSGYNLALIDIKSIALIVGCTLMAAGYMRQGLEEIDVYPSHSVVRGSITIILSGGYLFIVGVLAQIVAVLGGAASFQSQAFLVLVGVACLAIILFSDRVRTSVQQFVSRNLQSPQHDFRKVWTQVTQRLTRTVDPASLCGEAARIISESFDALSVTVWMTDVASGQLRFGGSTSPLTVDHQLDTQTSDAITSGLQQQLRPFIAESVKSGWAEKICQITPKQFNTGGNRICIALLAGERVMGLVTLSDRVNGKPYSVEELDLLQCVADQIAAHLVGLQLTGELLQAKEMSAFQTMSAFFVHDLKNAASSLGLMLQNLPIHFDDPEFRADALRGIGKTVDRINQLIARLGALRNKLELVRVECDLNQLVKSAMQTLPQDARIEVIPSFSELPPIHGDREQLLSVITNLLLNSHDALTNGGHLKIATSQEDAQALLRIEDNGCGMSADFLRHSLFRPFQTTKKKGLGIGMFQSKIIVEAHHGKIQVESEEGKGTVIRVSLPLKSQTP